MPAPGVLSSRKLQRHLQARWWEMAKGQALRLRSGNVRGEAWEIEPGPQLPDGIAGVVSAADFPIVGDDTADDVSALQQAMDEAATANHALWIPPPSTAYRIESQLDPPSNLRVFSFSPTTTIIRPAGSFYAIGATDADEVAIEGLSIDCVNLTGGGAFQWFGARELNIQYCILRNAPTNTIIVRESGSRISDDVEIFANRMFNVGTTHHVAISGAAGMFSQHIHVGRNRLSGAGECGINFSQTQDFSAIDNRVENWSRDVAGNSAVRVANGSFNGAVEETICGNAGNDARGFHVANGNDVEFSGNSVHNIGSHGLLIAAGNNDVVFAANVVRNCHETSGGGPGVRIDDATDCAIVGNRIRDPAGNHTWGVEETGTSDHNTVTGNALRGNPSGGVSLAGANSVATANTG